MADASAPGKLVVAGEYAVLHGAPAIALAVDIRARVSVRSTSGPTSVFQDSISGREFPFGCSSANGFQWLADAPGDRGHIMHAVLTEFSKRNCLTGDMPAMQVDMNTDAFYRQIDSERRKLGLGSSAAVLVALTAALFDTVCSPDDAPDIRQFCHHAHTRFQGGEGSGIDVATAIAGGVISMRMQTWQDAGSITQLHWPRDFFIVPVWSGASASTVDLLSRFNAYRSHRPIDFERRTQNLIDVAENLRCSWVDNSASGIVDALCEYEEHLRGLDVDGEIGIITEAHNRLRKMAESCGAHYKTSGAGGGDFGFAFTGSQDSANSVREAFVNSGFLVLEVDSKVAGLTTE